MVGSREGEPIKPPTIFIIQTKTGNNSLSALGRPTESLPGGPNITEQHQSLHRGLE